ncbi:MAG: SIMPL domain-containing protein [Terriglobales bacterium]
MRHWISWLAVAGALGLMLGNAQTLTPAPNTIAVAAEGQFQAAPDTAVIELQIAGQNSSLKAAYAQAQAQAEQVRGILRNQGFAPQQAHWSSYRVQPNFDYKAHRVADYAVTSTAELSLTDFDKIGPLVDAFGQAGISALRGVRFELKDMAAAKTAAIQDAYRQVHREADALALAAGRKLGELSSASVDVSLPNVVRPVMYAMAMRATPAPAPTEEFTPQTITVNARVNAVFRLQP